MAAFDNRPIDYEAGAELGWFVWGVKRHPMYPAATLLPQSDAARRWSHSLGIVFHNVLIETNAHRLTLLFRPLGLRSGPDTSRSSRAEGSHARSTRHRSEARRNSWPSGPLTNDSKRYGYASKAHRDPAVNGAWTGS
ncbi:hypothetical protein ABTX99_28020 [Streptomyces flaveolus]|uniref:YxiG-like protein n=1 Tax=Streptomyces flaveolus TaxID=67297 RepID=UPI003333E2AA